MLKSTFKKVSAIAIAGTMLAGMMAVPANAMSNKPVYTPKTIHVIDENFNSYEEASYTLNDTNNLTSFLPGNERIQYCREFPWQDGTAGIAKDGDEKVLAAGYNQGFKLNFDATNPAQVKEGDIVTISFRFKYNISKACRFLVNLNDATPRFTYRYSTNSSADASKSPSWASTTNPRIMSILPGDNKIAVSDAWSNGMNNMNNDIWYTVTATINTKDSAYDNKQTLKIQCGSWYMIGEFDANYTGENDTTYDLLTSVDSLQIDTYTWAADNGVFNIDDLKIDVDTTEAHNELVSDLSKTVLNETFDNLVNTTLPTTATSITGTSLQGKNVWGGSWTIAPDTVGGNAVAKITAGGGSQMAADFDDVTIGANDEIHVSYDREFYTSWRSGINMPNDGFGANDSNLGTRLVPVDNTSIAGTGAIEAFVNGKLMIGVLDHGDCWPVAGETHHVEYVIKVSDPEYGNKQTLTYTISGGENSIKRYGDGNYSSSYKCVYYFDADSSDDEDYTKLTSLNNFGAYVEGAAAYTLDNLKVEVVKPGFEVVGVANTGNTYTFRTNDPIDLKYVVDASAASKVIIAQYGADKRMIDATTENVSATDTVTVTPNPNAKTIKVMVLDMSNALPYTKAFVMTRQ